MEAKILLKTTHQAVSKKLSTLSFEDLWPAFKPYPFAFYNDEMVYYNHEFIPKTNAFIGNTSIMYQGEHIAIWYLPKEIDIDTITSLIVHEMFHAFQHDQKESRFPHEIEFLFKMKLSSEYLSYKYLETEYLTQSYLNQNQELFLKALSIRKLRNQKNKTMVDYEANIEVIEGTAKYVELKTLKQLNITSYHKALSDLLKRIKEKDNYLNIRLISYDIGALLLLNLDTFTPINYQRIQNETLTYTDKLIENLNITSYADTTMNIFEETLEKHNQKLKEIIHQGMTQATEILHGDFTIAGLNVYDVKKYGEYFYATHFLMLQKQNETELLRGNFILKSDGAKITSIYKLPI